MAGAGEARRAVWACVRAGDAGGVDPGARARQTQEGLKNGSEAFLTWRPDRCLRGLNLRALVRALRTRFTGGAWQGCDVVVPRAVGASCGVGGVQQGKRGKGVLALLAARSPFLPSLIPLPSPNPPRFRSHGPPPHPHRGPACRGCPGVVVWGRRPPLHPGPLLLVHPPPHPGPLLLPPPRPSGRPPPLHPGPHLPPPRPAERRPSNPHRLPRRVLRGHRLCRRRRDPRPRPDELLPARSW
jgi:hypothetical protein